MIGDLCAAHSFPQRKMQGTCHQNWCQKGCFGIKFLKMAKRVSNPFMDKKAAKRYQEYRPQYHDLPFKKLKKFIKKKPNAALDVACGTGHSTKALAKISKKTIGADSSREMLEQARKNSKLQFVEAQAEKLPFENETFDLINISMGFHWVDQTKFLKEAKRLLRKNGFLTVDNFGALGKKDDDEFKKMEKELYLKYLPRAARNKPYLTDKQLKTTGFKLLTMLPYVLVKALSLDEYANYVMSQSNFLFLSKAKKASAKKALYKAYRPFFRKKVKIKFLGVMKVYKKK